MVFLEMDITGSTPRLLEAARSLKLKPILLSTTPWYYKDVPAAKAVRMREMTVESIVAAVDRIGRERVAGVFTPRSARAELAARVGRAIERPHSDPDAIAICHQKLETRRFLEHEGHTDVAYRNVKTSDEAYSFASNMGGNAVLKPHATSGAEGIKVCRTPEDARDYADVLFQRNPNGVLIEEYVEGPMFGIETFHGKVLGIRQLHISDHDSPLIIGEEAPAQISEDIYQSLSTFAEEVLSLIGYKRGFAQVQAVFAKGKPCLIEINPRIPTGTAPTNIKAGFGIDAPELCLRFACGLSDDISSSDSKKSRQFAAIRHLLKIDEPIRRVSGVEAALKSPNIIEVTIIPALFYRRGPVSSLSDRVAYVQSSASSAKLATDSAIEGLSKLSQVPENAALLWCKQKLDKRLRRLKYGKARS